MMQDEDKALGQILYELHNTVRYKSQEAYEHRVDEHTRANYEDMAQRLCSEYAKRIIKAARKKPR